MGETTLTIDESVKEQLEDHRTENHNSWSDTLEDLMGVVPSIEEIKKGGCVNCDDEVYYRGSVRDTGGIIRFFHTEYDGSDIYGSNYYCSPECLKESDERNSIPREPDEVIIGGKSQIRTEVTNANYHMSESERSVLVPIPGGFDGKSSHGKEYDYIGEPVYVKDGGRFYDEGVIEEIIHEGRYTILILGDDHETVNLNHPDEERRENYKEQHQKWSTTECASCGTVIEYPVKEAPDQCPNCDADEW